MASILMAHGIALAGLGFLTQQAAPGQAKVAWIAALAGGGLCLLWGLLGMTGRPGRGWAVLTLIGVAFALLSQVVTAWLNILNDGPERLVGALLLTLMLALVLAMLLYLLHGERPPEFYQPGSTAGGNLNSRKRDERSA